VTGLARKAVEVIKQPFETKIIEELKPPPDMPPPPPPKLALPPPPFIPPPEVQIQVQAPQQNVITSVTNVKPPETPRPAEAVQLVRVAPVVQARSCKTPEYPAASRRLEETGAVVLSFLVGVDGIVLESKVDTSSGHPKLDEAARQALSLCKFSPGTVDGKPEQSWHKMRYVWKLDH
jgi:periplasmic protein TonB